MLCKKSKKSRNGNTKEKGKKNMKSSRGKQLATRPVIHILALVRVPDVAADH